MKLENLEIKVTVIDNNNVNTNYEFKLGSYELDKDEPQTRM